jgi:hypothetical protein
MYFCDSAARHRGHHWDLEEWGFLSSTFYGDACCGSMLAPGTNQGAARNAPGANLNAPPLETLEVDVPLGGDPAYSTLYSDEVTLGKLNVPKGGK